MTHCIATLRMHLCACCSGAVHPQVPLFGAMESCVLDSICERLEATAYIENTVVSGSHLGEHSHLLAPLPAPVPAPVPAPDPAACPLACPVACS